MKESFRVHMKTISHRAHIISKKHVFFQALYEMLG